MLTVSMIPKHPRTIPEIANFLSLQLTLLLFFDSETYPKIIAGIAVIIPNITQLKNPSNKLSVETVNLFLLSFLRTNNTIMLHKDLDKALANLRFFLNIFYQAMDLSNILESMFSIF